jgi:hypothetical protein
MGKDKAGNRRPAYVAVNPCGISAASVSGTHLVSVGSINGQQRDRAPVGPIEFRPTPGTCLPRQHQRRHNPSVNGVTSRVSVICALCCTSASSSKLKPCRERHTGPEEPSADEVVLDEGDEDVAVEVHGFHSPQRHEGTREKCCSLQPPCPSCPFIIVFEAQ